MMDQFVVWSLRGITYLCVRDENHYYFLHKVARLPNRSF